jgi:ApaG protein
LDTDSVGVEYKERVKQWSINFAGFRAVYPRMHNLYTRMMKILKDKSPDLLKSFVPPRPRAQYDELCAQLASKLPSGLSGPTLLPPELGCWYQLTDTGMETSFSPMFGILHCYEMTLYAHMLPQIRALRPNWNAEVGDSLLIMLPNIRLALRDLRGRDTTILRGNLFIPSQEPKGSFVVASSFDFYIENFVLLLERGIFECSTESISRWPARGIPEQVTRDTIITASFVHHPQTIGPSAWLFMYYITISMPEDAHRNTSKLRTRKWRITDRNGKVETVSGPGVIGEFPEIGPGDSFSYSSCCPLPTPGGTMSGSFEMQDMVTGELWEAIVPTMNFKVQKTITAVTIAAGELQTS